MPRSVRPASMALLGLCLSGFLLATAAEPGPAAKTSSASQSAPEARLFLGKPLAYWTAQARAKDRQEEVGRIVEALILALKGEDLTAVVAAADALEVIGPPAKAAAPVLAGRLDNLQPWVRVASMNALTAIGKDAVPSLLDVFEKGPPAVRTRASLVLAAIGPDARQAIPAVKKAIQAASGDARDQFLEVLAKIEGRTDAADPTQSEKGPNAAKTTAAPTTPAPGVESADWPQFHGPLRDSCCRETGLLKVWPKDGPKHLWKAEGLGKGYSTISIARGKIFTMGDRARDGQPESQFVIACDLATGKELWATRVGPPHDDGPRCTPTVDGDLLYALGTDGELVCLETATGKFRWQKNLVKDFGGKMMSGWKYSESPLVDGPRLICTPGAPDAALVALDKKTGSLLWKAAVPDLGDQGKDGAAYASAVVAEIEGVRQYVQMLGRGVVGVAAADGRFLWGYNPIASRTANITSPIVRGNYVFATNSYNAGASLVKITRSPDAFKAEEVYHVPFRTFENHHGGVVLVGDYLYGGSGQNRGDPVCLEFATGKVAWRAKAPSTGSAAVLYADGHVLFRYDRGLLVLVEATPAGYRVKSSFQPVLGDGPAWPHPVIHQGKLYLRHGNLLACYDLRESG